MTSPLVARLKADLVARRIWRLSELFELIEDDAEVFVVCGQLSNNRSKLAVVLRLTASSAATL
jgi:hypothetical protein